MEIPLDSSLIEVEDRFLHIDPEILNCYPNGQRIRVRASVYAGSNYLFNVSEIFTLLSEKFATLYTSKIIDPRNEDQWSYVYSDEDFTVEVDPGNLEGKYDSITWEVLGGYSGHSRIENAVSVADQEGKAAVLHGSVIAEYLKNGEDEIRVYASFWKDGNLIHQERESMYLRSAFYRYYFPEDYTEVVHSRWSYRRNRTGYYVNSQQQDGVYFEYQLTDLRVRDIKGTNVLKCEEVESGWNLEATNTGEAEILFYYNDYQGNPVEQPYIIHVSVREKRYNIYVSYGYGSLVPGEKTNLQAYAYYTQVNEETGYLESYADRDVFFEWHLNENVLNLPDTQVSMIPGSDSSEITLQSDPANVETGYYNDLIEVVAYKIYPYGEKEELGRYNVNISLMNEKYEPSFEIVNSNLTNLEKLGYMESV